MALRSLKPQEHARDGSAFGGLAMSKQEDTAGDLEKASAEIVRFVEGCPDSVWHSVSRQDGRAVAAIAYHCAAGNDVALGWVCQMLMTRPIRETPESHDAANDAEGLHNSNRTKRDVADALQRTTERTAHFLRSLTDEELERKAMHGLAGREVSVGQFIGNFSRHMRDHLESLNATQKA
jgi:hypothetical protein